MKLKQFLRKVLEAYELRLPSGHAERCSENNGGRGSCDCGIGEIEEILEYQTDISTSTMERLIELLEAYNELDVAKKG